MNLTSRVPVNIDVIAALNWLVRSLAFPGLGLSYFSVST